MFTSQTDITGRKLLSATKTVIPSVLHLRGQKSFWWQPSPMEHHQMHRGVNRNPTPHPVSGFFNKELVKRAPGLFYYNLSLETIMVRNTLLRMFVEYESDILSLPGEK